MNKTQLLHNVLQVVRAVLFPQIQSHTGADPWVVPRARGTVFRVALNKTEFFNGRRPENINSWEQKDQLLTFTGMISSVNVCSVSCLSTLLCVVLIQFTASSKNTCTKALDWLENGPNRSKSHKRPARTLWNIVVFCWKDNCTAMPTSHRCRNHAAISVPGTARIRKSTDFSVKDRPCLRASRSRRARSG